MKKKDKGIYLLLDTEFDHDYNYDAAYIACRVTWSRREAERWEEQGSDYYSLFIPFGEEGTGWVKIR